MDYINIKLNFHFYILKSNLRRNIYLHNYDEFTENLLLPFL